jgi:hypothetical protein
MTELTSIEELEIHGGKWHWGEFMSLTCGIALTTAFLGSGGPLGLIAPV